MLTKETLKSQAWQYLAGVVGGVFPGAERGDCASGSAKLARAQSAISPEIGSGIDYLNVCRKSVKGSDWFRRIMHFSLNSCTFFENVK